MNASGSIEVPMDVEVFPWVGVEQLPSDVIGENHQELIETILNGTYTDSSGKVTEIGLNNPDSYINNEIKNRSNGNFWFRSDILGSMDFWERSDIEKCLSAGVVPDVLEGRVTIDVISEKESLIENFDKISVTAGASTPQNLIDEVVERLETYKK